MNTKQTSQEAPLGVRGYLSSLLLREKPVWQRQTPTLADLKVGFIVSILSVTFALSVSNASNMPPAAGFYTAIISGVICFLFGGNNLGITGMAAGLAPLLAETVTELGGGDKGYRLILVGIMFVGMLMFITSYFIDFNKILRLIPHVVLAGMLGGIGIGLILKQSPIIWKNDATKVIGLTILAVVFLGEYFAKRREESGASSNKLVELLWKLPPQIFAIPIGIGLAVFFSLNSTLLVHIPGNPISAAVMPDFSGVINGGPHIWAIIAIFVFKMYCIDSLEHNSTALAMSRKDRNAQEVVVNLTQRGAGASNALGSLVGSATTIIGGIKTTCSWVLGAVTNWSNFFNASFLLFWWAIGKNVINMIPYCALAPVLIHAAWKLISPVTIFKECRTYLDLIAFLATAIITYEIDLFWGVIAGVVVVQALRMFSSEVLHRPIPRLRTEPVAAE